MRIFDCLSTKSGSPAKFVEGDYGSFERSIMLFMINGIYSPFTLPCTGPYS